MNYTNLGKTGEKVSTISLGTWAFGGPGTIGKNIPVGWSNQKEDDSKKVLFSAADKGINHWDTADVYGDGKSELIIGTVWGEIKREDIFLATKVGWDMGGFDHYYHPILMKKNIERSLSNMKTDYIDLLYLHHCNFGKNGEYFSEAINIINTFKEQGKVRFLGISDWSCKKIMHFINRAAFDVVQPYRNVMDSSYSSTGLKDFILDNDLGVCFFSPIKHGLLTGKYLTPPIFEKGDHRANIKEFFDQNFLDKIIINKKKMEERFSYHSHPVMHGLIGALLSDSPTGCVLLGQRDLHQLDIALTLGEALSSEDANWVRNIYQIIG